MIQLSNIEIQSKIVDFVAKNQSASTGGIEAYLKTVTRPTLSRYLSELKDAGILDGVGEKRGAKYILSRNGIKAYSFTTSVYDEALETGNRILFNHTLFSSVDSLVSKDEEHTLNDITTGYRSWNENVDIGYKKLAFERCAIEFAWKSSKIEGNTYTLLETENLIKQKEESIGKPHDDAVMILNQKHVFDLIYTNAFKDASVATLIDMHTLLMKDLGIPTGLRKAQVGITGTQYTPLSLPSQMQEALEDLFALVATIKEPVEKAVVVLAGIAYIQPFADGNKRASRHFANFVLHVHGLPPVAWRTVDEIEYKKAMIAFYELGNIEPIKKMWLIHYKETFATFFV